MKSSINIGLNEIKNGSFQYFPNYFSKIESDFYFDYLQKSILWSQESMRIFGKKVMFPRLTAWYGDPGKKYSYSGLTFEPHFWTEELNTIRQKINIISNRNFNSVLLNLYRGGIDSMSWHSDNEKELGRNPIISSVNFGATRTFQMRHIKTREKISIELKHGSLLIMQGEMQHYWQHQVPKTLKKVGARVNLTFRVIQ